MKKRILGGSFGLVGAFVLACALQGEPVSAAEVTGTINKGVMIGASDVSGMTAEEAKAAVRSEVERELENSVTLAVGSSKVSATAEDLGMTWANEDVVDEAIGLGKSGNIVKRYKDNKDLEHKNKSFKIEYKADKEKVKSYLKAQEDELNCEAVDGSLKRENGEFVVEPGVIGVKLNVEKSVDKVYTYMNTSWKGEGGTIELEADEEKPRGTAEELAQITDVLGSATTYYGSTYERNTNVEIGAAKLDGSILFPGESFSVTQAVIPFTAENGYMLAPSYESGKVVDTYGGGICQVSTTLYNALLKAELEITERHNHTMIVTYVDPSKDAAIAEGLMDLQFVNNTDAPIYIEGYGYGGELTFNIFGKETRPADRTVEYVSETLKTIEPDGVKLYAKSDADVGYISQTQSSHTGKEACLWKNVTENGETTTTKVNTSTYQAVPVSYEIGIRSSDANLVAQLQTAIANNDLAAVQSLIAGGSGGGESEQQSESQQSESQQSESQQSETQPTEAPQTPTEAPQQPTEAPQTPTEAPQQPTDPVTPPDDIPVVDM